MRVTAVGAVKDMSTPLALGPLRMLESAVAQVPALRYAVGVGGIAAVVAIILTGWKLEPQTAVFGGLIVFIAMVVLVAFAALSRSGPRVLRPLALFLAWAFMLITVTVAGLFVGCAFFDQPKTLPCLLKGQGCAAVAGADVFGSTASTQPEVEIASRVLGDLYAGRLQGVYERFSATVKANINFAQFRATARKELAQLGSGPLRRQLAMNDQQAGFLFVAFDAEFDELSTWREIVTFVKTPKAWELYRFDFQPRSWTGEGSAARILTENSPTDVLVRIRNRPEAVNEVTAGWLPPAGWRLRVSSVLAHRSERTCDVRLNAEAAAVVAHNVLGGCDLAPGSQVLIVGKVVSATANQIDIDQVKFQPVIG